MTDPDVVAFHERESCHPDTGAHGILRREWRLVPFNYDNPIHVAIARNRNASDYPTVVLEQRYIRRGTIEPWEVFDGYATEDEALTAIDAKAVAIHPRLVWIQHDRLRIAREHEAELARKRIEADQLADEIYQRRRSRLAWEKLYNSPKYRPLCDEWDEFAARPTAQALGAQLKTDAEFMRLYRLATIESITALAKRKAIRECLDYYNFMWLHREVEQSESEPESES